MFTAAKQKKSKTITAFAPVGDNEKKNILRQLPVIRWT